MPSKASKVMLYSNANHFADLTLTNQEDTQCCFLLFRKMRFKMFNFTRKKQGIYFSPHILAIIRKGGFRMYHTSYTVHSRKDPLFASFIDALCINKSFQMGERQDLVRFCVSMPPWGRLVGWLKVQILILRGRTPFDTEHYQQIDCIFNVFLSLCVCIWLMHDLEFKSQHVFKKKCV